MTQCVIVGAGIIGLLQARLLAQAGWQVHVYDQGTIGHESSWAGGGILSPLYPWRYPEAVSRLAQWSQDFYPRLAQELLAEGQADPEWTPSGLLILDATEQAAAQQWANQFSVACEQIDHQQLMEFVPGLTLPTNSALWLPKVAQIRNPRLVKSLYASCLRAGVKFYENRPVQKILHEKQRVTGVQTAAGPVFTDQVIISSGAWSAQVLHGMASVPVRPIKGQMIVLKGKPDQLKPIVLYQDRYLIPRRDGRILVGSTVEDIGFDKQPTAAAREGLVGFVQHILPKFAELQVEHQWCGLRPASPSGIPYICAVPNWQHLYLNSGHFRNGLVLGPASTRLLADMLLGKTPILDSAPYRLSE